MSSSILDLFLQGSGSITSWLCIAVPQRSAHFPMNTYVDFSHCVYNSALGNPVSFDFFLHLRLLIPIFFSIFIIKPKRCTQTADWLDSCNSVLGSKILNPVSFDLLHLRLLIPTLRSLIQGEALIKRVDWNFCPNLISGEALIIAGRMEKIHLCRWKSKKAGNFLEY